MTEYYSYPDILILDPTTLVPQARISDYEKFEWTHDWYGVDEFTIKINRHKEGVSSVTQDSWIAFKDDCGDWCLGIIKKIIKPLGADGKASEQWTFIGVGSEYIFTDRQCIEEFNESTTSGYYKTYSVAHETAMRALVNKEVITCADSTKRPMTGISLAGTDYKRVVSTVKLILRGEGADTSTTILDSSQFGRTITVGGNAQIDTAQFKFGSSSILFDGTGDYVKTASSSDFSVGTNDLGVAFWVRFNALPTSGQYQTIWTDNVDASNRINFSLYNDGGALKWRWGVTVAGTPKAVAVGAPAAGVSTGTWYYIAGNKTGTVWTIHQDGVLVTTATNAATVSGAGTIVLGIHYDLSSNPFNGWMDDAVTVVGGTVPTAAPVTQYADPYTAEKNIRGVTVGSVLEEWKKASGLSCGLVWAGTADGLSDRRLFTFTVWAGTDRSSTVKLSVSFGNIQSYNYVWSVLSKKNLMYVGGSGDEDARLLASVWIESTEPTGWDRKEGFLDASDCDTTALMAAAGKSELESFSDEESLEFSYNWRAESYIYGTDFELGDTITVLTDDGVSVASRIIKMVESYDPTNGKILKVVLGTAAPDLVSIVRAQNKAIKSLGGH